MRFIISFTIISVVTDVCWTETEKESQTETTAKDIIKFAKGEVTDQDSNNMVSPLLNGLWANKPLLQVPQVGIMDVPSRIQRQPYSMTKLAKSLTDSFDLYFNKEDFEPFEKRPKPITLVAFRKTGLQPRLPAQNARAVSSEVAELQSPFNEISNFWSNSPYD